MKDLKGTKTEKNLQEAFAGESQARNKYTYYASKAKKDGFVQISNIFLETAAKNGSKDRERARGALSQVARQRQEGVCILQRQRRYLAVQQLRTYHHRQEGTRDLSRLRSSQGLLPGKGRKLLIKRKSG